MQEHYEDNATLNERIEYYCETLDIERAMALAWLHDFLSDCLDKPDAIK